jgi:hypothetical protein
MSDKVEYLDIATRLDVPVERVLDGLEETLESVVVIGWDKEGEMVFASSMADGGDVLWLLEKAKNLLLEY